MRDYQIIIQGVCALASCGLFTIFLMVVGYFARLQILKSEDRKRADRLRKLSNIDLEDMPPRK